MPSNPMIVLRRADLGLIAEQAAQAYPLECCGLLVGHRARRGLLMVTEVHPSTNIAEAPRRRFEIDPGLRIRLEKRLRGGPEAVVGVYHSHPDGRPQPSRTDLESVIETELIWLIAAVDARSATVVAAHRLLDGGSRFKHIPLTISE